MHRSVEKIESRRGWGRVIPLGLCALALPLLACDTESIINLPDPDLITRPIVEDTANLPEIRNGVLFEFTRALAGPAANNATPGIVGLGGLLADELWYSSTFPTMQEIDRRIIEDNNGDLLAEFRYLQRARNLAERAAELYVTSPRVNSVDHALVTNLAGFTYVYFAENFCSGVPFSQSPFSGAVTYGPGQTTAEMYNLAIARFDAAITMATALGAAGTTQLNVARVGKARAQLGLGQAAAAAATVTGVPDNFVFFADYGDLPAPQNGVWYNVNAERRSSAASQEGVNGIRFFNRGNSGTNTIDARTPADSGGAGIGTTVVLYRQGKYPAGGSDIPIASGIEAQLIRAEAAANAGASTAYLTTLNTLRGSISLGNLTAPATASARLLQLFEERAKWLWLTGHRLGDLRRLVARYGFTQQQVFPTGQTIFGQTYGTDVNLPIPFAEANNPNYSGQCIDRGA
jgi:hypothetical protein